MERSFGQSYSKKAAIAVSFAKRFPHNQTLRMITVDKDLDFPQRSGCYK
jgi:hypothetical protein